METALSVPAAFASFLVNDLGMLIRDEPQTAIGLWLSAQTDLYQIVDLAGLKRVPGSYVSRWFNVYALADTSGQEAASVAETWIAELSDECLHLDGLEEQ